MAGVGGVRTRGLTFLVFTEDGAASAVPTITALSKVFFQQVIPGLDFKHTSFRPVEDRLRSALSGNKWKSTKPNDQRHITDVAQTIAGQLATQDGFVIFHFDGDVPYAQQGRAENPKKFQKQIVERVYQLLLASGSSIKREPAEAQALLDKLLILTPYYCIEAWTYYNNRVLRNRCTEADFPLLDSWQQDPALLEELNRPWDHVSAGKAHNRELVEQDFPSRVAIAAQKSFADIVNQLKKNTTLISALTPLVFPWLQPSE